MFVCLCIDDESGPALLGAAAPAAETCSETNSNAIHVTSAIFVLRVTLPVNSPLRTTCWRPYVWELQFFLLTMLLSKELMDAVAHATTTTLSAMQEEREKSEDKEDLCQGGHGYLVHGGQVS